MRFLAALLVEILRASHYVSSDDDSLFDLSPDEKDIENEWVRNLIPTHSVSPLPFLQSKFERVDASYSAIQTIQLGVRIARTRTSSVFHIVRRPEDVIKYQIDCDPNPFHTLAKEFAVLKLISDLEIAPKPKLLSEARAVGKLGESAKTQFTMDSEEWRNCKQPLVRYLVMTRTGATLFDVLRDSGRQSVEWGVRMLISVIKGLQQLHQRRIVHGDVHQGNVAFKNVNGAQDGFVLIDFEFAKIVPQGHELEDVEVEKPTIPHPMHTPWVLQGYPISFRDDLYRALETFAIAIAGNQLYEELTSIIGRMSVELAYQLKSAGYLFKKACVIAAVPMKLREVLEEVRIYIQQLDMHELPNHERLIQNLIDSMGIQTNPSGHSGAI